jgi:hypothetical protein
MAVARFAYRPYARCVRGTLLAIVANLVLASTAVADAPSGIAFSYIDDSQGGLLSGYTVPDGAWGTMTWEACPPNAPCSTIAADGDGNLHVGSAAPGTVFRATASDGEQSVTATSDPYLGPLRKDRPPGISGQLRVGHVVRAVAGAWSGGWGGEQPYLQLQACRTRRSGSCEVIASTFYWERCGGVGAVLPKHYAGWYLRVADNRLGRPGSVVFPAFAPGRPQDLGALKAAENTAVRTVGRIRPGRVVARTC